MAHALLIRDVATRYSPVDQDHFLEVTVEVFNDEESKGLRKFAYDLETPVEAITADLKKQEATLDSDLATHLESAVLAGRLSTAEKTKAALMPKEEDESPLE